MFYFKFNISNPWRYTGQDRVVNYVCKDWSLSKNKNAEIQISKWGLADSLMEFVIDLRWRGHSHAGPNISMEIGGYFFCIRLYDHRHWNYKKNDWDDHDETNDSEYAG